MEELALEGKDHIKLCDLLAVTQLCESAGVAKNIIATGVVKVDGKVELRKRAKILRDQVVEYQGKKVKVV
ncbi:MAG: RNA-binding S4 domain-containing protein [Bdellovibrionales bacterium]|nr:RNA-binding S4 domain-containing protein [Oligoflexia bacterium]